jgi:uncharacterized membrane protein
MKQRAAALVLLLACAASSCAWNSEWVFGVTKATYGHESGGSSGSGSGYSGASYSGGEHEAGVLVIFFAGVMVLPIAIDLVCLPFAATHDLFFLD